MEDKRNDFNQLANEGGLGRTGASENDQPGQTGNAQEAGGQRDISDIDQQEGQMHNGVLGGNFGEKGPGAGTGSGQDQS